MPRGGARKGQPGKPYPNRSDMRAQKIQTVPGQTYGEAGAQRAAQQAIPLPQTNGPMPGQYGPLDAPSMRPNEPLTAGLSTGPGPGPEALGLGGNPDVAGDDEMRAALAALYRTNPNSDLARLIGRIR